MITIKTNEPGKIAIELAEEKGFKANSGIEAIEFLNTNTNQHFNIENDGLFVAEYEIDNGMKCYKSRCGEYVYCI